MTNKRIFAVLFTVLAFSAVVGASFANATGGSSTPPTAVVETDTVDHQCPPDCNAADKADEATEVQGAESATEAPDATEASGAGETPDAAEASNEGSGSEGAGESDGPGGHEDPAGEVDHQFEGNE